MKRFTIVEQMAAGNCCAFERPFALALAIAFATGPTAAKQRSRTW